MKEWLYDAGRNSVVHDGLLLDGLFNPESVLGDEATGIGGKKVKRMLTNMATSRSANQPAADNGSIEDVFKLVLDSLEKHTGIDCVVGEDYHKIVERNFK